ncbi:hypothetical protein ISO79_15575 [Morganella morganii subsp. morganii]|uniref:hypothetical protein n=1 Tax=Morganella morganii TaxID=582 RepID=UPI001BD942DF|nr:hypothetical protein [Morganella morganii]MBT0375142.1 hypothetical protein [Morganella morganii subsp. morganii]
MNLITDFEIKQFTHIQCNSFSDECKGEIIKGMGLQDKRTVGLPSDSYFLIVSQDCDIFNDNIEYIEAFLFNKARSKDARTDSIKYTRNYQKIVITESKDGDKVSFLIKKDNRFFLKKSLLISELERLGGSVELNVLSELNRNMILDWIIKSYSRVPLPDGFNRVFFSDFVKNKEHPIHCFLIENKELIIDIFLYCSPMDDEDADEYHVTFTALVSLSCTEEDRERIESEFKSILESISTSTDKLTFIQLHDTPDYTLHEGALMDFVMTIEDFTKKDEYYTHRLNLDFMCYTELENKSS